MSEEYRDSIDGARHRFDSFMKLCTKHKILNAYRDVESACIHINEIPLDDVEELLEYWDRYPVEQEIIHDETLLTEKLPLEVEEKLQILPKRIRTVIILSVIYGKTTREIADHLSIHHSTVWKYKSMGIKILREYLTESGNVRTEEEKGK